MVVKKFLNADEWSDTIVQCIKEYSKTAIYTNDWFHIVLLGGDTPRLLYGKLAKIETDWSKWHFWIGDERMPSETFNELNMNMIQECFLNHIPYKLEQVHFMMVNSGLDNAVDDYKQKLKAVNLFDVTLLGIGEDGHTASLFPGNDLGTADDSEDVITVTNAPKAPKVRLSMSARRLSMSENVLFLVKGVNKKNIVQKVKENDQLPCTAITGSHEPVLYYCSI